VTEVRTAPRSLRPGEPHVWRTLGYRQTALEPGASAIEWDAPPEYAFPAESGHIVHGGLLATLLDTAMAGACYSVLAEEDTFLTANLNVEFFSPARPGTLRAEGRIVHRTKRMIFCAADLRDADGTHLASARCTQVLRTSR
jgi:uncharacterized protein (TIGR00369 family)